MRLVSNVVIDVMSILRIPAYLSYFINIWPFIELVHSTYTQQHGLPIIAISSKPNCGLLAKYAVPNKHNVQQSFARNYTEVVPM